MKELQVAGIRVTSPRVKVLRILEQNGEHLSADEVYKILLEQGENIGLATVYRVLMQFVDAGLVEKNFFKDGKAVFEYNRNEHHDHMVSLKTGKVVEFYDEVIEARQQALAAEHGFILTDHKLTLYGVFDDES